MQVLVPNTVARETLKRGDHIYAYRQGHSPRHGIYDGEGQVIHYVALPSDSFNVRCVQCGPPIPQGVERCCLRCFLAGTTALHLFEYSVPPTLFLARVHAGTCTLAGSDPPDDVMRRATQLLIHGGGVSAYYFLNRCEDFAVYCKTGLLVAGGGSADRSGHAVAALTAATAVAASPLRYLLGFAGSALVGVGVHCLAKLADDIAIRRDVIKDAVKVPVELLISGSAMPGSD